MIVVLLPDGGRGYLSKIFNDDWMADYGFLTEQTAAPKIADVLARRQEGLPIFVHAHPDETVAAAIAILREYNVSQLPVMKEEPPVMVAEVVGSVVERDLLDALVSGRASPKDPVGEHMSAAAAHGGLGRAGQQGGRGAGEGRGGRGPGRRPPGRHDHPSGRSWPAALMSGQSMSEQA